MWECGTKRIFIICSKATDAIDVIDEDL